MRILDAARRTAEEELKAAHSKLEEAEEERRSAALKVEAAKERARKMNLPVGLARPLVVCIFVFYVKIFKLEIEAYFNILNLQISSNSVAWLLIEVLERLLKKISLRRRCIFPQSVVLQLLIKEKSTKKSAQ